MNALKHGIPYRNVKMFSDLRRFWSLQRFYFSTRVRRRQQPLSATALIQELEPRRLLSASTGTWTESANPNPNGPIGTMMLLTDGTVIAQGPGSSWSKLTPDSAGNYVDGAWLSIASMNTARLETGMNVLPNGNVFVIGGEYSGPSMTKNWANTGEIYDPVANTWSPITSFPNSRFGDDPTVLLANGQILAGYLSGPQTYLYDPASNTWTQTGSKLRDDRSDEETWTLLPDGSVLSVDVYNWGHAQRYIPSTGTWVDAGTIPVALTSSGVGNEMGPATMLPDGRFLQIGANGNSAIYNPTTNTWVAGPTLPAGIGADDAPGAMLPNGQFIFLAEHTYYDPIKDSIWHPPTTMYDFDYTTNTVTDITPTGALGSVLTNTRADHCRMLVTPNGNLLLTTGGTQFWDYAPNGSPQPAWRPQIIGIAQESATSFTLSGTNLTGISAGASYGDDAEMDTNFPIVALTDPTGHVSYARTTNWTPSVASGNAITSVNFTLPNAYNSRLNYQVSVIANGISSNLVRLSTGNWSLTQNANPNGSIGTMVLLTDGTIIAQGPGNTWSKLTPDSAGNYLDGTWSTIASMNTARLYTGINVLPNGKVVVFGGENSGPNLDQNETNTGEIYDPVADTWTPIAPFPQTHLGDDPSVLLPNGKILVGYQGGSQTYLYDPTANTWTRTGYKLRNDSSSEETWTLLPDGSVLSVDISAPGHAQRYLPSIGIWVDAGKIPVALSGVDKEMGPATMLPDGRFMQVGANGNTAIYTPSTNKWVAGPTLPAGIGADDAPGAMLPNGQFVFLADHPDYHSPTRMYAFDYTTNKLTDITPTGALGTLLANAPAFEFRMLVAPNGSLLLSSPGGEVWSLVPNGTPSTVGQPNITSIVRNTPTTFTLSGTNLTGISAGASYGDDAEMDSNYPIVTLTDPSGNVLYARTTGWTPSVASGSLVTRVNFTLPSGFDSSLNYQVAVVANGISSAKYGKPLSEAPIPVGPGIQVSPSTQNASNSSAGIDSAGDYVVAWSSQSQSSLGTTSEVDWQQYNSAGQPVGSAFTVAKVVNSTKTTVESPSVAVDGNGTFMVTWETRTVQNIGTNDNLISNAIEAQLFNMKRESQGPFTIVTSAATIFGSPNVASNSQGQFVITWQSSNSAGTEIDEQQYNSGSVAEGPVMAVAPRTTNDVRQPSVAMDSNGDFVVAWTLYKYSFGNEIDAQRYNSRGVPLGTTITVSSSPTNTEDAPSVAMDSRGDFVVAWENSVGGNSEIDARRFNSFGVAQGDVITVNRSSTSGEFSPRVAIDANGDFVVTWESDSNTNDRSAIEAQLYNSFGKPQGTAVTVYGGPNVNGLLPAVAMNSSGDFVISFIGANLGQNYSKSVFAQRYSL